MSSSMRNLYPYLLAGTVSALLIGCGGSDTTVVKEPTQPANVTVVQPAPATTVVQPAPAQTTVIEKD
jgi:hypothetical protein